MDIFILAVSAAVLFTLGYGVVWTVVAVRRVGIRRFSRALAHLSQPTSRNAEFSRFTLREGA